MSRYWAKQTAEPGVLVERARGIFLDWGTLAELPANGSIGYMPGALYDAADQGAGANLYINNGTFTSSLFQLLSATSPTFTNITMPVNAANAFYFTDGTTKYLTFDTRVGVTGVSSVDIQGPPVTIASAAGVFYHQAKVNALTTSLTGTTTITSMNGLDLFLDTPTVVGASAVTVSLLSTLYVAAPVAGTNVTSAQVYAINAAGNVGVSGSGSTLGYVAGSGVGGAVTQATSRTTAVTLNEATGAITLFTAAGSATAASFTLTNSTIAATDTILFSQKSGTNLYVVVATAVGAGSCTVTFFTTGGTASDAPVFNFVVIKGSAS